MSHSSHLFLNMKYAILVTASLNVRCQSFLLFVQDLVWISQNHAKDLLCIWHENGCYPGTKFPTEVILHCPLNHRHTSDTPLETLPCKPLQNPRKILQTTWRDMSLFHCLGVPAHINKRITQNLTNSRRHSISVRFFFFFLFCFIRCATAVVISKQ